MQQRTLATAIIGLANNFGVAISFVVGPQLVKTRDHPTSHEVDETRKEVCALQPLDWLPRALQNTGRLTIYFFLPQRATILQLFIYLLVQLGAALALFVCVLAYFPDRPKDAPTISAGEQRTSFWTV